VGLEVLPGSAQSGRLSPRAGGYGKVKKEQNMKRGKPLPTMPLAFEETAIQVETIDGAAVRCRPGALFSALAGAVTQLSLFEVAEGRRVFNREHLVRVFAKGPRKVAEPANLQPAWPGQVPTKAHNTIAVGF